MGKTILKQKNESVFDFKQIENTPFTLAIKKDTILKTGEEIKEIKILCGNHLCSDKVFDNEDEAIDYIMLKPYELIMSLFLITLTNLKLISNNKK